MTEMSFDEWCTDVGLKPDTIVPLKELDFDDVKSVKAITQEVIETLKISVAQKCVLRQAALKLQKKDLDTSPSSIAINTDKLKELEEKILQATSLESQDPEGSEDLNPVDPQKGNLFMSSYSCVKLPRAHEAVYVKPKGASKEKIGPFDITYSEFISGNLAILEKLINDQQPYAIRFLQYLKFLSKKSINFKTQAILEFDDEFRTMLSKGEASLDDPSVLWELQATHFDSNSARNKSGSGASQSKAKQPRSDSSS